MDRDDDLVQAHPGRAISPPDFGEKGFTVEVVSIRSTGHSSTDRDEPSELGTSTSPRAREIRRLPIEGLIAGGLLLLGSGATIIFTSLPGSTLATFLVLALAALAVLQVALLKGRAATVPLRAIAYYLGAFLLLAEFFLLSAGIVHKS